MGGISIKSNIAALQAQRQIAKSSSSVNQSLERLSSGLRINSAVDDAAGLSIASTLKSKSRVYTQAVRNGNDAISALNIAEGGLTQLSSILTRLKELAESAANGVYVLKQRRSLDTEAYALTQEFNRIVASSDFNGQKLLDGTLSTMAVQLGYGTNEKIDASLTSGLARDVGTGQYDPGTNTTGSNTASFGDGGEIIDIDGDGINDLVLTSDDGIHIRLGTGNGNFGALQAIQSGFMAYGVAVKDINGDGRPDVVSNDEASSIIRVSLNQGGGTFSAATSYTGLAARGDIKLADINGDGALDIVTGANLGRARTMINDGSGGFTNSQFVSLLGSGSVLDIDVGDFNGDGFTDIVGIKGGSNSVALALGNGQGGFAAPILVTTGTDPYSLAVGDFNHDGISDLATVDSGSSSITTFLGSTSGTLGTKTTYTGIGSDPCQITATDINRDGITDLAATSYTDGNLYTLLGKADGTFQVGSAYHMGSDTMFGLAAGDLNGDGAPDILAISDSSSTVYTMISRTVDSTNMERINLTTRQEALNSISTIDQAFDRVTAQLSAIGSSQSRLSSALNTISARKVNYDAAAGRILDSDIAEETASLVANQIREQLGATILAQANQAPLLALKLLKG